MDDIEYLETNHRYSKAVIHRGIAYLAGQVAATPSGDVAQQTSEILAQIDVLLARCGTDKSRLLTAKIYLKDMRDFDAVNRIWDAWVVQGRAPTRTPFEARLAAPEYVVEIEVRAAREAGRSRYGRVSFS